jgi:beta-galactosidase
MFFLVGTVMMLSFTGLQAQVPYQNGEQQSFNQDWLFIKGEQPGAEKPEFDDQAWRTLDLPHDWAIEGPFDVKYNARAGGLPFHGTGWYRKHFRVPGDQEGKRVKLLFDGAMSNAEVWVNGKKVGERPYGYSGFFFDVTDQIRSGEENVVAVKLTPEDLSSRWYPGAGIYRNTWIEYNNQVHFAQWGTYITTPEITKEKALVRSEVTLENHLIKPTKVKLKTKILGPGGDELVQQTKEVLLKPGKNQPLAQQLEVFNPMLWDLDSPHLYQVVSVIVVDDKVVDTYKTPFGIRTIEFSAEEGFKLNGRYLKLQGVCLHHDLGPLGGAVNRRATERQLEIMKSMGVNSVRTSHNPPSPELLEFCDRLGLLVQDEAFDCWQMAKIPNGYNKYFDDWFEADLRDMIRRDHNHPSVFMWSIGNEILEQSNKEKGWIMANMLSEICHDQDPTRPVTAGFNHYPAAINNRLAHHIDVVGLNYKPTRYIEVMEQFPEMIVYGSETSSCVSSRGVYHLPIEKYKTHESLQVTSYDLIGPPWAYPPDIEFMIQDQYPNVLGEYIWTGFDYLGEPTPYGGRDNSTNGYWNADWPSRSSYFGAVDLCGLPKDRYYLYQSQWTKTPMIHLLPHWNWKGMEGKEIPVYGYTNCEEAELFLNGKSLGKKVKGVDKPFHKVDFRVWDGSDFYTPYRLRWDVPYKAGELKIVGYLDGEAVSEKVIHTAGKPAGIRLIPDRQEICADGQDLSYITVEVVDKKGNVCPLADNLVNFEVTGAGKLRAVGNGNAATTESFQAPYRKAFSGKCMLIVQSGTETGTIGIKATSKGLKAAKMELIAVER